MNHRIKRAELSDVGAVALLFDEYRQFYQQSSDTQLAQRFIQERIANSESVIFFAESSDKAIGFVQLYPSFSSVKASKIWILNDLYVVSEFRKMGVAKALMKQAKSFAQSTGAAKITLCTAQDNYSAQKLYEAEGYELDTLFLHYALVL